MTIQNNFSAVKPSLLLEFANTRTLDPRITFTRASTGTYYDQFGVLQTALAGVPRFDHDPVTGESLGLLIEEQSTNLLTYSEQFDNASWNKTNSSITANTIVAPDGTLTGDKLVEDTANSRHWVGKSTSLVANTVYTLSVYLKAAERTTATFGPLNTSNWATTHNVFVNLANGTITSAGTATIQSVGNGWYRVSVTNTFGSSNASGGMIVDIQATSGYQGDGTSGIYIWGAQLAGPFPTSYIPTVASQVTRSADAASMTDANFSSWYRQDEGTFFVDYQLGLKLASIRLIAVSDGTSSNYLEVIAASGLVPAVTSGSYLYGFVNGSVSINTSGSGTIDNTPNARRLFAGAYKANDYASCNNGGTFAVDSIGAVPSVNRMFFSNYSGASASLINGTIKRIAYFPERLSNAQLQALTS